MNKKIKFRITLVPVLLGVVALVFNQLYPGLFLVMGGILAGAAIMNADKK